MNLAVIGSRSFSNYELLQRHLQGLKIDSIVSGGARGADSLARIYAERQKIPLIEHKPDYQNLGRKAPLERNKTIIQECDQVVAFWDGVSRGTAHAIRMAERMGRPVTVVRF